MAIFEACTHMKGIIGTCFDAKATIHATGLIYVEDVNFVISPLLFITTIGVSDYTNNSKRAILCTDCASGTAVLIPSEFLTSKPRMLGEFLFGVLDGEWSAKEIPDGDHKPFCYA